MPFRPAPSHDVCPDVVIDLLVVVLVGIVVVVVTDADDEDDQAGGVVVEAPDDDEVDPVADDPPSLVVPVVGVAEDAVGPEEIRAPSPMPPAEATIPVATLIRRTRVMARSRCDTASRRGRDEGGCGMSCPFAVALAARIGPLRSDPCSFPVTSVVSPLDNAFPRISLDRAERCL